jgi:hypothetical protein
MLAAKGTDADVRASAADLLEVRERECRGHFNGRAPAGLVKFAMLLSAQHA